MKRRPVIGIITAKVTDTAQRQLLRGMLRKARELDVEIVVISNILNFREYFAGTVVENKIYDLAASERFDGLILNAESILNPMLQQYIYERLVRRGLPVVVTGAELPGMTCLNTDMLADFEAIADHLLNVHQFTEFDFLTGPAEYDTSHERVKGFRNALDRHGLILPDENIIYGDFWTTSGEQLGKDYAEGRRRLPQAVVCANDYMAFGICDVLLEHGIAVPDEISVIGYEYACDRIYHAPILTTYQRNREALGARAMLRMFGMITGSPLHDISIAGHMVYGDTCPCRADHRALSDELSRIRRTQYYTNLNFEGNFEQQLTVCRSIEDYIHTLQEFCYLVRDVTGLYLCLYENWTQAESPVTLASETDDAPMLCYRINSQQPCSDPPQFYIRRQLCPERLSGSRNHDFLYLAPIFFAGRELGYFILQYDTPDSYDPIFGDWLKIATNGLEALRMKNDIHALLECQNLSEHHDTATGLWNSEGFFSEIEHALRQASPDDQLLLVLVRVSIFSDDSSIDGQSNAIRMEMQIADGLKKAAPGKQEFCAKLGDHQFCIGAVGTFQDGEQDIIADRLQTLILHTPVYSKHRGPDTLACAARLFPTAGADPCKAVMALHTDIAAQISRLSAVRSHPSYQDYRLLRHSMLRHPQQEWNAQVTCRNFHLSYGHFRATYKELFGVSFHQDVIACRISLAKNLLLTTSLSVQVIAYQCGYDDDKYFLRQFRQHTGCTPNAYRNQ